MAQIINIILSGNIITKWQTNCENRGRNSDGNKISEINNVKNYYHRHRISYIESFIVQLDKRFITYKNSVSLFLIVY